MGCCDNTAGMLSVEEARQRLSRGITAISETEQLPLEQALDRILAEDVHSSINVPGYDNSAMDGYALRAEDLQDSGTLIQVGKSFAGAPYQGVIQAGQCVRIMTGAVMPDDADTVVMQEDTEIQGERIHFNIKPKLGSNVRHAGEDIARGECILQAGHRLNPADIGLLSSIGMDQVSVYRPLRIAIFSTGDELRLPGEKLDEGCIYDSNRLVVKAILRRLGVEILDLGIIPDEPDKLRAAFQRSAAECDGVISSGGVSVGEADYTKDILEELGEVGFWKVAMKPGKPFAFGSLNGEAGEAFFFGLPGNPVSATVTFHQLALPTLRQMAGEVFAEPLCFSAQNENFIKKGQGRADFQRGILQVNENGEALVATTGEQGSGILQSMSKANCYIVLDRNEGSVESGQQVTVQPFDKWLK